MPRYWKYYSCILFSFASVQLRRQLGNGKIKSRNTKAF